MIVGEGVSTRSAGGKDRGRQGRGVGGVGRGRRAPERAGRGWPARGGGWQGLRRHPRGCGVKSDLSIFLSIWVASEGWGRRAGGEGQAVACPRGRARRVVLASGLGR